MKRLTIDKCQAGMSVVAAVLFQSRKDHDEQRYFYLRVVQKYNIYLLTFLRLTCPLSQLYYINSIKDHHRQHNQETPTCQARQFRQKLFSTQHPVLNHIHVRKGRIEWCGRMSAIPGSNHGKMFPKLYHAALRTPVCVLCVHDVHCTCMHLL